MNDGSEAKRLDVRGGLKAAERNKEELFCI